ncbi:hypothetical protein AABM19_03455, partial [Limosilactobacillus fermentum]|uniref:hypothetical protein n=2 Tax=Limosilactobacillus fermentum TaxID=1613 RepID=UPI00207307D5
YATVTVFLSILGICLANFINGLDNLVIIIFSSLAVLSVIVRATWYLNGFEDKTNRRFEDSPQIIN